MTGKPPLGADQLVTDQTPGIDPRLRQMTCDIINELAKAVQELRTPETAPDMESLIMTAAVTYAGALHGEMLGLDIVADLTDEALQVMLVTNFRTGQRVGLQRIADARERVTAEDRATTGQGPVPS